MNDPLERIAPLLSDDSISEIMIDGWQNVYVEKDGAFMDLPALFQSEAEVYELIRCLVEPLGAVVDEARPMVQARLADGLLVNVVVPPVSLAGPVVTINKPLRRGEITIEKLLEWNCISQPMVDFLRACVLFRLNIAVGGGTSSGKTTLLHVLSRWIPDDERIVVLQRDDFRLDKKHIIRLDPRPADIQGQGEVSMRELVNNTRYMRPDRIIVTEVRGAEVLDLVGLMNNGHDGTLFSLHANGVRDVLSRLEMMAGLGSPAAPLLALREQIASALDLIVYQERLSDGSRRVLRIAEVTGMDDGQILTRDLFEFRRTGVKDGKIQGYFTATGAVPFFLDQLQDAPSKSGLNLPLSMFTPSES